MNYRVTLLLFLVFGISQAQNFKIVPGTSKIQSHPLKSGNASSENREVTLKVEHWGAPGSDASLNFTVVNSPANSNTATIVSITPHFTIAAGDFRVKRDTVTVKLFVSLNATKHLVDEVFDIYLQGQTSNTDPRHRVIIQEQDPKPSEKADTIKKAFDGVTFLNGVNFNFDGKSNSNYVGNFNIFAPDLGPGKKLGVNVGILKIDYSKAGDSLNSTIYRTEYVKLKALDSLIPGKKYLRQFNKVNSVVKNTSLSFYVQPLYKIFDSKKLKLFGHLHAEFLVSKWSTSINVTNIQQDTITVSATTQTANISPINKFPKALDNTPSVATTSTALSYVYGLGATFIVHPVEEATLCLQLTYGHNLNYYQPSRIATSGLTTEYAFTKQFYLTRVYIKYKLSSSLEAVLGTEFRGLIPKKGKPAEAPVYACYLGANIGLGAISDLLKK